MQLVEGNTPKADAVVPPAKPAAAASVPRTQSAAVQNISGGLAAIPQETANVEWVSSEEVSASPQRSTARVLVHVRQMHTPPAGVSAPPEIEEIFRKYLPDSQKEQRAILEILARQGGATALLVEGMPPERAKEFTENLKLLREGQKSAATLEKAFGTTTAAQTARLLENTRRRFGANPDAEQQKVLNALRFLSDYQSFREDVAADPTLRVASERRLTLIGPESGALLDQTVNYVKDHPTAELSDPVLGDLQDKRDAAIVTSFGSSNQEVGVLVLGAGHDLRTEVAAYNKAHPERPITLVEVTPTTVGRFLRDTAE